MPRNLVNCMRTPLGKKDVSCIRRNARAESITQIEKCTALENRCPSICNRSFAWFRSIILREPSCRTRKIKEAKHTSSHETFSSPLQKTLPVYDASRMIDSRILDSRLDISSLSVKLVEGQRGETLDLFEFLLCTMSGKGVWKTAINASPMEAWTSRDSLLEEQRYRLLLDDWKVFELMKQYGGIVQYRY